MIGHYKALQNEAAAKHRRGVAAWENGGGVAGAKRRAAVAATFCLLWLLLLVEAIICRVQWFDVYPPLVYCCDVLFVHRLSASMCLLWAS